MDSHFFNKPSNRNFESNSFNPIFWNMTLDKGRLKSFVFWFLKNQGEKKTLQLLEELKNLGFGYATKAGISLGIEDLKIPPRKVQMLAEAESTVSDSIYVYRKGEITGIEKVQRFIETWHETSENLKQEVVKYFEKTDVLNPVYMMAFSGARGNLSQVRQLVGMRGLMADPQGKIIDFPIQSNFREGLTLTEYLISTYGARKGIVDTALRTATAGYLTRRLVDVAQHVLVAKFDCGTQRGIFLFDMKEGTKTIYSFENRLTGRVLAQDIYSDSENYRRLAARNQEIDSDLAIAISKITKKALVRSPLTCETRKLVCQLCYGWSLATSKLVSIGEAVGVIAGQSIGEPGTQLTMRTFHTGGVFSGGITEQINTPFSGRVEYGEPIAGTCVRTSQGFLAFLTKTFGTVLLKQVDSRSSSANKEENSQNQNNLMKVYKIPAFTILFARQGEVLEKGQILAQISALPTGQKTTQIIEQTIYSSLEGEVFYSEIDMLEDIDEKYGERISKSEAWGKVWVLAAKVLNDTVTSNYLPMHGDFISKNCLVNDVEWITNLTQSTYLKRAIQGSKKIPDFYDLQDAKPNFRSKIPFQNLSKIREFEILNQENQVDSNSKSELSIHWPIQILSKPSIRERFTNQSSPDFHLFEKTRISNSSNITKASFCRPKLKLTKTHLAYSYSFDFHSHLMKLLSQTVISVPLLQPGALILWLQKRQNRRHRTKITNIRVSEKLKTNRSFLLRKLNLNKNFHLENIDKPNLGHPLILNNLLPCFITYHESRTQTVLKSFLSKKRILFPDLLANSIYYPYFTNGLKSFLTKKVSLDFLNSNNSVPDVWFSKKFKETFFQKFPSKNKERTYKGNLTKSSSNSFQIMNRHKENFHNKGLKTKFDHFVLKTCLLSFNVKDVTHNKLGYFLSIINRFDQKDIFMSLLPILGESFLPSSHRNRVMNSELQNPKKNQRADFLPIDILTAKNTDFWSPNCREGFYWFPAFSSTLAKGLISISSPFFVQKRILKSDVNYRPKNVKAVSAFKKTLIDLTNLAQSQTKKETSFLKSFLEKKSTQTTLNKRMHYDNNQNFFCTFKVFSRKDSKACPLVQNLCLDFSTKKTIPFDCTQSKKAKGAYVKIRTEKLNKKRHFLTKSSRFFSKNKDVRGKFKNKMDAVSLESTQTFFQENFFSKLDQLKKSFFRKHSQNREDSKKFSDNKDRKASKKSQQVFGTLKILSNSKEKSSVCFNEIAWLPQEDYILRKFLDEFSSKEHHFLMPTQKSKIKIQTLFREISNSSSEFGREKRFLNVYLTNFQGLKKPLKIKEEGLVTLRNSSTEAQAKLRKKIGNSESFKTKLEITNKSLKKKVFLHVPNVLLELDSVRKEFFLNSKDQPLCLNSLVTDRTQNENLLNKNFCFYLLSKIGKRPAEFLKNPENQKSKPTSLSSFPRNCCINSLSSKPFFSFVPLFRKNQKKLNMHLNKQISELSQAERFQNLKSENCIINVKPGWIYKTNNPVASLKITRSVNPGSFIFDDISFDQRRIFIERIFDVQVKNSAGIEFLHFYQRTNSDLCSFHVLKNVNSLRPRFLNASHKAKNSPDNEKSCYFLIRPFSNQYLPNIQKLKSRLYKSIEKRGLNLIKTSYSFYKDYFLKDSNRQTRTSKILNDFLPSDIHLSWINPFFSAAERILKSDANKMKFKKSLKNFSKKTVFQKDSMDWLFFQDSQKKNDEFFKEKIEILSRPDSKKARKKIVKDRNLNEILYFSYRSLNCLSLKVSLSLKNSRLVNQSFSEISFNTSQTNIPFWENDKNTNLNHIKGTYLQLLMFRSFLKNNNSNLDVFKNSFFEHNNLTCFSPTQKSESMESVSRKSFVSKILKESMGNEAKNILSSRAFSDFFEPIPFFEYSLSQRYAFFANQKLFSSSFYEHQAKKFFRILVFKNRIFGDKDLKNQRFMNQVFDKNLFYESYRNRPISKNQIFLKKSLKNKTALGSTSFYSPFEGEVLKIYSEAEKEKNLQKNVSLYLEKSLLEERRLRKLILTRADLFSLAFSHKNLWFASKTELKNGNSSNLKFKLFELSDISLEKKKAFFNAISIRNRLETLKLYHQHFQALERNYLNSINLQKYDIARFNTIYQNKRYKIKALDFGLTHPNRKFRLGELIYPGEKFYSERTFLKAGLIIHLNQKKLTLRKAEFFSISPQAILHTYNEHCILKNQAVMTLPFQTLKTGDIVQGIPKVEQYLEARTTVNGRLFLNSLPVLLDAIYKRYANRFEIEKAVRQSFLKIQQILVDGVQRVYRSQGVSIADKHLEVIVRQMTSKVKITYGGQTGFFPGELVDLEFVERMNRFLMVKIQYEPVVLGITRASLEVDSFLSAASFQQTTKVLSRAALENKRDFLKGLKENLLVGNLLPAGTGYVLPVSD